MNEDAKHIIKRLSKPCPECGCKKLAVSEYKRDCNGVVFYDRFEECLICGYMEQIKDKRDMKRMEFE